MSLLNDMLRDLSHQQKTPEINIATPSAALDFKAQEQRELFYHTSAAKPLPHTLVPSLLVFVVVVIVLALWKFDFFIQPNTTDLVAAPLTHVKPVDTAQRNITPPTMQPVVAAEPELGERIAALESAITNLSTLVAQANVQPAVASTLENKTFSEESDAGTDASLQQTDTAPEQVSASVSIQEPFAAPIAPSISRHDAQPLIETVKEQGEPALSIAPNPKWQDQQQAQQANQLMVQGQTDQAINQLQAFIATAAQPRESAKALLDIFSAQENIAAMQELLSHANYLSPVEQSFYNAKIAVIQQQDAHAILLLESHLDEAEQNENYRSLLAGLYQRTGMSVEAATHYRRLLSAFGDKPAYWLGFALAQDALNNSQVAMQAYQRVNQYADLQPQVRTYVQQRIAALQQ